MPNPAKRARTRTMSQAKMRLALLLVPLVTLCGCAVVNSAPPPDQVRQLRDVRDACLARNVVALDDYRSDAATIGMAVVTTAITRRSIMPATSMTEPISRALRSRTNARNTGIR